MTIFPKIRLTVMAIFTSLFLYPDEVASQTCNATERNITALTTEMLTFTSPGYNGGTGTYISNMDCWWIIDSGADDLKLLIFITYDLSCPGDKFYIYDGDSKTDPTLANGLCGSPSSPAHYSTAQRYARVEMVTDGSVQKAGIKIDVVAAKDYSGTGCKSTQTITATDEFQFLSGPNFPEKYASDSNCRWAISNSNGNLEFEVLVSDIEDDDPASCDYDKYMIYDGPNKCDNNNIKKVCSEYPKVQSYNFTSVESTVTITLESDSSVNRRGFLLRFKASDVSTTSTVTTTTVTMTTTRSIAASSSTSNAKGLEMNLELLLGIVFGSLILISFTIVTVIIVVKKVQAPTAKTITPVQPYRPRPNIPSSLRPRRQNGTGNNNATNNTKQHSIGHKVISQRTMSVW